MSAPDQPPSAAGPTNFPETIRRGLTLVARRALFDPDDALDAVQETVSRALEAVRCGRVPDGVPLANFTYGIARHVIADVLRRRARAARTDGNPDGVPAPQPSPLEHLIAAEEREAVRRALRRLPVADRDLLRWCYVDGERIVDIARRLGEPAERVRKRKSRALERLREIMAARLGGHISSSSTTLPA